MTVNITNPYQSYYAPACRNCGSRTCKNCFLRVTKGKTLRELLDHMVSKKYFKDNQKLFMSKDDLRNWQNTLKSDDEDEEDNQGMEVDEMKKPLIGGANNKINIFSDDDDDEDG